jgi:Domain of unknown function (DUF4136)
VIALAIAAAIAMTAETLLVARVKVRVEHDKTFDFKSVRTWSWNPKGRGEVKMARTQDDDPEAMRQTMEPLIVDAVSREMKARGLQEASGEPDLYLTYYVLLSNNMSAQTMGQFLPATTGWGLPPFAQATQSLEMMNRGSLVLDLSSKQGVVWRGLAQAELKMDADAKKRESVLREGVRDLLRRYPPR